MLELLKFIFSDLYVYFGFTIPLIIIIAIMSEWSLFSIVYLNSETKKQDYRLLSDGSTKPTLKPLKKTPFDNVQHPEQ